MQGERALVPVKKGLVYPLLFTGIFLSLYLPTLAGLVRSWESNQDYSHGFLIIPITLYLVWSRRGDIVRSAKEPSRLGIPVMLLWAVLFILGVGAEISTFERVSLIPFLLGCALSLAGRRVAGILAFPILFLIFMIPIPAEIYSALTNPLAILATTCSVWVMRLASIPVCQEGNLILLPHYSMEVMDVCSGMRSLVSIFALALLMGYRFFSSFPETLCLLILSIPVSILGNIARITVTGFFSYELWPIFPFWLTHAVAGVTAFIFSIILLLGSGRAIRWVEEKRMQYISWHLR